MTGSEYQRLVEFLGRQFTAIDQRFDSLQQHIDDRFREVFGHLDAIYRRLEALELEYQAIVQSLRRIEGLLADEMGRREALERGVDELKRNVAFLQARIEELERRLRS
jgi:chromosome segregation ATPase